MMHSGDWQRRVDYHERMIDQRDTEIAGIDAVLGPKPAADAHKGDWQIYLDRRQRRRRAVADRTDHQQRLDRLLANPPQPAQQEAA